MFDDVIGEDKDFEEKFVKYLEIQLMIVEYLCWLDLIVNQKRMM